MALTPTEKTEDKKAQRKAAEDEVLLREIDDAVRQDQYADFAKNYGKPLLAVIVVGLLAFAGYLFWDSQNEAAAEKDSEALVAALDQVEAGNLDTAGTQLDALIADSDGGARATAQMLRAGIAQEQGNNAQAAEIFGAVAADSSAPQSLRDLATIRQVAATFDDLEPSEVISRLRPIATPGHAYFGSAAEMVAMAYLEQGKQAEAGALFAQIAKDENAPETLKSRARQIAGLLGVDAVEDVDEVLDQMVGGEEAPAAAPQN